MIKTKDPDTGEEIEDYSGISEYKKVVYDELFSLTYYGNGGWDWQIAYNLPVHIRRYCLKLLNNAKKEEQKEVDKQSKGNKSESVAQIPNIVHQNIKQPPRRKAPN